MALKLQFCHTMKKSTLLAKLLKSLENVATHFQNPLEVEYFYAQEAVWLAKQRLNRALADEADKPHKPQLIGAIRLVKKTYVPLPVVVEDKVSAYISPG
jgi:hypothetical protein